MPSALRERQEALEADLPHVIPLLVFPRLSRADRRKLAARGVNHMDLMGNLWIRRPDLLVDVEGRRMLRPRSKSRSLNPFSKKASLVARALLAEPSRRWGVRELADAGSLSVGYVSELLQAMGQRGYAAVNDDGHGLGDAVALLRDWSGAYRWEDNELYSFVSGLGPRDLLDVVRTLDRAGSRPVLTLLSGLDLILPHVRHDQVQLYVPEMSVRVERALSEDLRVEPVRMGGNLHLIVPYYGPAALFGSRVVQEFEVVSDVQLFLDLVHYPVRGPEAAGILLEKRLAPALTLSRGDVASVKESLGL